MENLAIGKPSEVVDILPQLLGETEDLGQEVDASPKDQLIEAVRELKDEVKRQGERQLRVLEEQTAAIRTLNATLTTYFYANGPQRGLTPLPSDKPPTPEKRQSPQKRPFGFRRTWSRVVSRTHRPTVPRSRVEERRGARWRSSRGLFREEDRRGRRDVSRSPSPKRLKSSVHTVK
jgi:hypothetical protein